MTVKQTIVGDEIVLTSPYHADAPAAMRNAGGDWDGTHWRFPMAAQEAVDKAVKKIYGVTGRGEVGVPARITAIKDVGARHAAIHFGGYVLASARGRDSGARTGEGVILEDGKISSGGSVKNWSTGIEAGAVFKIVAFPPGIESTDDFKVEYLESADPVLHRNEKLASFTDDDLVAEIRARNITIT